MKYCFGVDIGGTTVKMGLFEATGTILENGRLRPTQKKREKQSFRMLLHHSGRKSRA